MQRDIRHAEQATSESTAAALAGVDRPTDEHAEGLIQGPVDELLVEEFSIDGMCGVY